MRHLQLVARWLVAVDHVLRRRELAEFQQFENQQDAVSHIGSLSMTPESTCNNGDSPLRRVAIIVIVFGPIYGSAMGSYAFVIGKRSFWEQIPQMIYSGLKVPLLIALTVAISLPSFFVINTLLGLRSDFRESLRSIVSAQSGMAVILVSLFPLMLFGYVSMADIETSYAFAILLNALMFGLASVSAQVLLRGYYECLIARNRRHLWMVRVWILVYGFVGIQAGYVLRPFIGDPNSPTSFFRQDSFQNAYVKVCELIWQVLGG